MQRKDDGTRIGQPLFCLAEWTKISESWELTQRESEVALAVLDGRDDSSIAEELGVSSHTVHTHLGCVYQKLGIGNRTQLVARVFREYRMLVSNTHCIAVADRCPFR